MDQNAPNPPIENNKDQNARDPLDSPALEYYPSSKGGESYIPVSRPVEKQPTFEQPAQPEYIKPYERQPSIEKKETFTSLQDIKPQEEPKPEQQENTIAVNSLQDVKKVVDEREPVATTKKIEHPGDKTTAIADEEEKELIDGIIAHEHRH